MPSYDDYISDYASLKTSLGCLAKSDTRRVVDAVDEYHETLAAHVMNCFPDIKYGSDQYNVIATIARLAANTTATTKLRNKVYSKTHPELVSESEATGRTLVADLLVQTAAIAAIFAKAPIPEFKLKTTDCLVFSDIFDMFGNGASLNENHHEVLNNSDYLIKKLEDHEIPIDDDWRETYNTSGFITQVTMFADLYEKYFCDMMKPVADELLKLADRCAEQHDTTSEVESLKTQLEKSKASQTEQARTIDELTSELERLRQENARLAREADQLHELVNTDTNETDEPVTPELTYEPEPEVLDISSDLVTPVSRKAIPSIAKGFYGNDIIFSRKAIDDLEGEFSTIETVWEAITYLAEVWLPAMREGHQLTEPEVDENSRFRVSYRENKFTRENPDYRAARTATYSTSTYGPVEIYTPNHLKGANLRIYFDYVPEDDALFIVRCTEHLKTFGSRRKGY